MYKTYSGVMTGIDNVSWDVKEFTLRSKRIIDEEYRTQFQFYVKIATENTDRNMRYTFRFEFYDKQGTKLYAYNVISSCFTTEYNEYAFTIITLDNPTMYLDNVYNLKMSISFLDYQ